MKITWYGTASLKIETENTSLLIDPFVPLAPSVVPVSIKDYYGVQNILVTHGHFDHIDNLPELLKNSKTYVYATQTPANTLMAEGVHSNQINIINPGDSFNIGDIKISAYQAKHIALDIGLLFNKKRFFEILTYTDEIMKILKKCILKKDNGEILGFMIESNGRSVFVLGSLGLEDKLNYPVGMDMLVLPYQGSRKVYDIALDIIDRLKPHAVLLDHFDDTFPPITELQDTSALKAALKGKIPVLEIPYKTPISV